MSREIKFRVWSENLERYLFSGGIEQAVLLACNSGKTEVADLDDIYIIEQYTGLKDKNGEEIYEGDIIEEIISIDDNITVRYKVYWDEDTLCWGICGCHNYDFNLHDELWETNLSREIIGNIHENKELL